MKEYMFLLKHVRLGRMRGDDQSFSSLIGKVVICLVDFKLPLILYHLQVKMSSFLADEWWSANWGCHQEIRNVSKLYIFNMLHQTLFKFNNLKKMFHLFSFLNKHAFLNIYYSLIVLSSYMMHVWRSGRDWWKITISTQEERLHDGTRRDWDTEHWSLLLLCILLSHLLLHDTSSLPLINQILLNILVLSQQLGNENFMMTITGELFLCKKLQICKNK